MPATDASARIDAQIAAAGGWRAAVMTRVRALVADAAPELDEDWKWRTAAWSRAGTVVLACGAFSDHVKVNVLRGASLDDPDGLFNAGLGARGSRAIDVREGDALDEPALARLVRAAADAP